MLGVLCAAIGSVQATETLKLLTGVGEPLVGRLMVHDALRQTWDTLTVRKDPDCAVCGDLPDGDAAGGLRGVLRGRGRARLPRCRPSRRRRELGRRARGHAAPTAR